MKTSVFLSPLLSILLKAIAVFLIKGAVTGECFVAYQTDDIGKVSGVNTSGMDSLLNVCDNVTLPEECYDVLVNLENDFLECMDRDKTYSPSLYPKLGYLPASLKQENSTNLLLPITIIATLYNLLELANNGKMDLILDFQLTWHDDNIKCLDKVSRVAPPDYLWTPKIRLLNPATSVVNFSVIENVIVYRDEDNKVTLYGRITGQFEANCRELTLLNYPFDKQTCSMLLVVENAFGFAVYDFVHDDIFIVDGASNDEWTVESLTLVHTNVTARNRTSEAFSVALSVKRNSYYYVMYLIIPLVIMQSLVGLVFIVPTENGAKLNLSATFVLVEYVLYTYVIDLTPQFRYENTPRLVTAVLFALFVSLASVVESVILQAIEILAVSFPKSVNSLAVWVFIDSLSKKPPVRHQVFITEEEIESTIAKRDGVPQLPPKLIINAGALKQRNFENSIDRLDEENRELDQSERDSSEENSIERRMAEVEDLYLVGIFQLLRFSAEVLDEFAKKERSRQLEIARDVIRRRQKKLIQLAWKRFDWALSILSLIIYVGLSIYFFGPQLTD